MDKLLWISEFVPYDNVAHAGGQNHNFHVKYFVKKNQFDIHLVSFAESKEAKNLDLEKYNIKNKIFFNADTKESGFKKIKHKIGRLDRYGGFLDKNKERAVVNYLKRLKNKGYQPKYIILQWTGIILMTDKIKKIFSDAKIIGINEDVSFLSVLRKLAYEKKAIKRLLRKIQYYNLKTSELKALSKLDLVVVNNKKDQKLLLDNKLKKDIFCLSPFFHNYQNEKYDRKNNDIIFFGAMNRPENYLSAIYFIEHIFVHLTQQNINFIVIGSKPPEELLKYNQKNIKILGYVQDIRPYFQSAMCLAAPLVLGAGVKIKILEAMSAGLPIITNNIGIEGIEAIDKKDFFYAENASDYLEIINTLIDNFNLTKEISKNAKAFIKNNYDLNKNMDDFILKIKGL